MTDSKYVVLYTVHVFSSCIEALCFQWPDPPTPDCLDSKSPELHRAVCVRFLLHFEVDITRAVSQLGEFSCEEIDLETQQSIYLAINCLLENPSNDVATKLATCRSLKKTANWEPVEGHDHPMLAYLGNNIGHIAILFTLVENLDSQKVLTETLGLIIQTADTKVNISSSLLQNTTLRCVSHTRKRFVLYLRYIRTPLGLQK